MSKKTLMENIENYIKPKEVEIDYRTFKLKVNENVSLTEIDNIIDTIVGLVKNLNFNHQYIDILMSYHLIKLFTDIQIPTDEENNDIDYAKCYQIAVGLNLKQNLIDCSPIIAEHIAMMEVNIWRNLDYLKTNTSQEELYKAIAAFYEILDQLSEVAEANKDINVEALVEQIKEISTALNVDKEETPLSIVPNINTAIPPQED